MNDIMKKLVLLILVTILYVNGYSQKNKEEYSGRYENGTASYEYYENEDFERIFHGNFEYKIGTSFSANGQFNNNLRSGKWTIVRRDKNKYDDGTVIIEIVNVTYEQGKLVGKATYKKTDEKTKDVLAESIGNFIDNKLIGNFTFESNDKRQRNIFSISINLNNKGLANGLSIIKYSTDTGIKFEDRRKFGNGALYWRLFRNLTTGEIIEKYDNKSIIEEYSDTTATYYHRTFIDINKYPYDSYWDLYNAIEFWSNLNCSNCGNMYSYNPLYVLNKGIIKNKFFPVKKKK